MVSVLTTVVPALVTMGGKVLTVARGYVPLDMPGEESRQEQTQYARQKWSVPMQGLVIAVREFVSAIRHSLGLRANV